MTQPGFTTPYPVTVKLDATGAGTARLQNPNATSQYKVTSIAVGPTNPASIACSCSLYRLGFQLLDVTPFAGQGDNAGGDPAYVNPGEYIDAIFTGGPANGTAQVVFYYEEIPLSGYGWGLYR